MAAHLHPSADPAPLSELVDHIANGAFLHVRNAIMIKEHTIAGQHPVATQAFELEAESPALSLLDKWFRCGLSGKTGKQVAEQFGFSPGELGMSWTNEVMRKLACPPACKPLNFGPASEAYCRQRTGVAVWIMGRLVHGMAEPLFTGNSGISSDSLNQLAIWFEYLSWPFLSTEAPYFLSGQELDTRLYAIGSWLHNQWSDPNVEWSTHFGSLDARFDSAHAQTAAFRLAAPLQSSAEHCGWAESARAAYIRQTSAAKFYLESDTTWHQQSEHVKNLIAGATPMARDTLSAALEGKPLRGLKFIPSFASV
jgi:hypothetical protein